MKPVSRNVRNYLTALAVLVLCACVYRGVANQLLTLPEVKPITPRPPTQNHTLRAGLEKIFPDGAWQLGDCKRLLTGNGALLFQNWRQIAPDQWKLEPLTLIVGQELSEGGKSSPIILTAKEGAEIQFAQALDMMGGSAPPIKMGRMIGDVHIERVANKDPSRKLKVKTRNVRIDNQKVWTTDTITAEVGRANLRGRDLTIYLAASATSAAKSKSASTLLDRMDLVYLESLTIPLDQPPDPTGSARPRRIGTAATKPSNGLVSIRCRNGMAYDFAVDQLSLRDSIEMVRSVDGKPVDRFDCETLDLVLREPANREVQRNGPLDWIDSIRATGTPARLSLSSYDFTLNAQEIDFDSSGGLLVAEGRKGIRLIRGGITADLARLAYQYNPETPETIGAIDVLGAGHITIDQQGILLRSLRWNDHFKLHPMAATTIESVRNSETQAPLALRVDGDVRAKLADGGDAQAGSIEGVLRPFYVDDDAPPVETAGNEMVQPVHKTQRKLTLVPEVFHAMDSVAIRSNQIAAATSQLSLYFEASADYGKRKPSAGSSAGVIDFSGNAPNQVASAQATPIKRGPGGLASYVGQPGVTAASTPIRSLDPPSRPEISGTLVTAKLLLTPDGVQPKDVSIQGDVKVKHQVRAGDSVMPIELSGQTMRLLRSAVAQSSGQDYSQLGSGPDSPAHLKMGDGYFKGPVIKVWPSDNVVQVTGAGELKVPTEVLNNSLQQGKASPSENTGPAGIAPADVKWVATPVCRWGGGMQFDGQNALFAGGVQIDAELISGIEPLKAHLTGQEMQLSLTSPVQLADRTSFAGVTLATVSIVRSPEQPVLVRAEQRSADDLMKAIHLMTADRLDFSPTNGGQLQGTGPGWYRGWMLTDKNSSLVPSTDNRNEHLGPQVLQGVHLTFRDSMHGDLKNETLAFRGGVRTGIRKLNSWDDSVDVAQMERLAIGEMTMDCEQLKFGVSPGVPKDIRDIPGMPTPWEMTAEGGVVVRTNTEKHGLIEGTASRVAYESRKSWILVEGIPGRSAFIRQTWPDGRKGYQTHSPRMMLNLKTYEFQTIIKNAEINNVPTQ